MSTREITHNGSTTWTRLPPSSSSTSPGVSTPIDAYHIDWYNSEECKDTEIIPNVPANKVTTVYPECLD